MGQRRRARECALQMLFQIDLTGDRPEEVFPQFWEAQEIDAEGRAFAERLVLGTTAARERLDRVIAACAEHWRVERMPPVDRNLLRLAAYELTFETDTPGAVVIDEAVEIGKRFGTEQSAAFINGILDAVRRRIERGEA